MATLPVGTIIPYYSRDGALASDLTGEGWWICDGRTVTDSAAGYWYNRPTPDLTDRFLKGTINTNPNFAGKSAGTAFGYLPVFNVKVETSGWDQGKQVYADPRLVISGGETWVNGSPIVNTGTTINEPNIGIPTVPPYLEVVFLISVK